MIDEYDPHKIDVLNLSHNHFDDVGCEHIAKLIEMNKHIKSIVLSENIGITRVGFNTVIRSLKKNNKITALDFNMCSIEIGIPEEYWSE